MSTYPIEMRYVQIHYSLNGKKIVRDFSNEKIALAAIDLIVEEIKRDFGPGKSIPFKILTTTKVRADF